MKRWIKKLFCNHDLIKRPLGLSKHGMVYSLRCSKCDYYHMEIEPVKSESTREKLVTAVQDISEYCSEHKECIDCQIDDLCPSFRNKMPDEWIKPNETGLKKCLGGSDEKQTESTT